MTQRHELVVNVVRPWTIKNGVASAPVTIMVEGVHNGSHGPIFWAGHILEKFADKWEGVPIVINHPLKNGQPISVKGAKDEIVGRVTAPYFDKVKKAIRANIEIPINNGRINLSTLQNIKEVSAGVFSDETYESGTWNDEQYHACSISMEPDHLALLPGGVGACSWQDGCGIRANQSEAEIKQIFENALQILISKQGGTEQMSDKLLPTGMNLNTEQDSREAQAFADEKDLLLPTQYNRSACTTKCSQDTAEILMPCGFRR